MARPVKRTLVIDHDENGQPITLEEQLISDLRLGIPIQDVCSRAGINKDTYYDWLKEGVRLKTAPPVSVSNRKPIPLTRTQKKLIAFSDAARKAEADGKALLALIVYNAATQPSVETSTVVKTRKIGGEAVEVVERTTTTRNLPPDPRWAIELLQRRWPKDYGRTDRHEHTGEDGEPIPLALRIEHILTTAAQTAELYDQAQIGDDDTAATGTNGKILELNPPRDNGDNP